MFIHLEVFRGYAKLSILDLSDNAFGPDGVDAIKKLLKSEACYLLHTLKLNNNGLGIGGGKVKKNTIIKNRTNFLYNMLLFHFKPKSCLNIIVQ